MFQAYPVHTYMNMWTSHCEVLQSELVHFKTKWYTRMWYPLYSISLLSTSVPVRMLTVNKQQRHHKYKFCELGRSPLSKLRQRDFEYLQECTLFMFLKNIQKLRFGFYIGNIDVGDGCWRRNVLVTTIRCWWRFWPFWSPCNFFYIM